MRALAPILLLASIGSGAALAAPKSFDGLACTADIEKSLVGRTMSDEPVAKLEARYQSLAAKDLGGYEVSDDLFLGFWTLCGDEYAILQAGAEVKAALRIGKHGAGHDAVICHPTDKSKTGVFVAIPTEKRGKAGIVSDRAWRVDEKSASFVPATEGPLECPPEPGD